MNLILFTNNEKLGFLGSDDYRAKHINSIIKSKVGDTLDIGILDGLKGSMIIKKIDNEGIFFDYELNTFSPKLHPVTFIIGTPRPPVAKRLLKDLSSSGVEKIIMCGTDLGEKTYLTSKLWKENKYMEYVRDGGIQSESTIVPEIEKFYSLKKAIDTIKPGYDKLAMDNINPDLKLSDYRPKSSNIVIAIGGERGFSDRERELLRSSGFKIFKMGDRILRTETACHSALGSILTTHGLI